MALRKVKLPSGEDIPILGLGTWMMGEFASQFEREMMLERQREGIAKAKAEGKYKGGKNTVNRESVLSKRDSGLSIRSIAQELKLSPTTVHKILHERVV